MALQTWLSRNGMTNSGALHRELDSGILWTDHVFFLGRSHIYAFIGYSQRDNPSYQ